MYTFEDHVLGRTDEMISVDTREDNVQAVYRMALQCRKGIEIISRNLDPDIYDSQEFVDAVKQMILQNRRALVRIIVMDTQAITKRGHRMLDLSMNLSSFIEFRIPPEEYKDFNEALFIADSTGYVHRFNAVRYEGKVNFNDVRVATFLQRHFDEMWDRSTTDMNFRRLTI